MNSEQLVSGLRDVLGENLVSIVLYGSAAAGDFVPGFSGHDVLIVVNRLGAPELAAMSATLMLWERSGNPLPQLFTPQELCSAVDAFPIELLDIQQSRRVLLGADLAADLKIDQEHYRRQLERDLKVRLQLLRRRYVACAGNEEAVKQLMIASLSTFLVLLRAALHLYNEAAPAQKVAAVNLLAKHIPYDPQPFLAVLELKRNPSGPPAAGGTERLFQQYLSSIELVVHAVDQHLHPSHSDKHVAASENQL